MQGKGVLAKPTKSFKEEGVYKVYLSSFVPTLIEEKRHGGGDFFTPAVLRLVYRLVREKKQDVVILSRTNTIPYVRKKIGEFENNIKYFLPKNLRGSIKISTTHSFKGNEADNVIIIDATDRRYPFIHPNWIFNQIFGDSLANIYDEEQRLFYVAVTRAKERLFIFTEDGSETPFIKDIKLETVNWKNSPPVKWGNKLLVKILNKDNSKRESINQISQKLKAYGFDWRISDVSSLQKIIDDREKFNISDLQKENWCKSADSIEVNINDEDESILAKYFIDDGKWIKEFDKI